MDKHKSDLIGFIRLSVADSSFEPNDKLKHIGHSSVTTRISSVSSNVAPIPDWRLYCGVKNEAVLIYRQSGCPIVCGASD